MQTSTCVPAQEGRNQMKKLYGITVAMTTPFTAGGALDTDALAQQVQMLVRQGVHCLYPCGTTGEMLHMNTDERCAVAQCVIDTAAHRLPVYIHVGAPDLESTLALTRHAEQAGADGIGVVTPIAANEQELEAYFTAVCDHTSLPVYLYNIPQNAKSDITPALAARLAERCENIAGIKYSFLDVKRTLEYLMIGDGRLEVMHGSDRFVAPLMLMGCKGTISGNAGIFSEPYVALYNAFMQNDQPEIQRLMRVCTDVSKVLRGGKNVAYFKNGLRYRGLIGGHMRAPQLDLTVDEAQAQFAQLDALCEKYGFSRYPAL